MNLEKEGALLQKNESLDIPKMSKRVFWVVLGPEFILIGSLLLLVLLFSSNQWLFNFKYLIPSIFWLVLWQLVTFGLFNSFCYPKTKILEEGLKIWNTNYLWEDFSAFEIQKERTWTSYATTTRVMLILYLKSNAEPIKVDLGKRNPDSIQPYLQKRIRLK